MRRPQRTVVLLHSDPEFTGRVARAAEGHFDLTRVDRWDAAEEQLRTLGARAILVADVAFGSANSEPSHDLRRLLHGFPSSSVVGVLNAYAHVADTACTLGKWGISQVLDTEIDRSTELLRDRLRAARGRALASLMSRGVAVRTSPRGRAILDAAVEIAASGAHPWLLARELRISPPTLLRWSHSAGLPPPRRILLWMRLLTAAEMLDDPAQRVEDVAHACGYSSDAALRRSLRRAAGEAPRRLRDRGAFDVVSGAFVRELERTRTAARKR